MRQVNGGGSPLILTGPEGVVDFLVDGNALNVSVGTGALFSNTTGVQNMASGNSALLSNTTGVQNTASGNNALYANTTGGPKHGQRRQRPLFQHHREPKHGQRQLCPRFQHHREPKHGQRQRCPLLQHHREPKHGQRISALSSNTSGNNNVASGYYAGFYETGSNTYYVNNQDNGSLAGDRAGSLIYGTFDATPTNQTIALNAEATIRVVLGTIASPPTSPWVGQLVYFSDAATSADCTVGMGTAHSMCAWDGAAWAKP